MITYPLELHDGHLIAIIDKFRVLIDTGAPCSIGRQPSCIIAGRTFQLTENFAGLDIESLVHFIGQEVDVLAGANIQ